MGTFGKDERNRNHRRTQCAAFTRRAEEPIQYFYKMCALRRHPSALDNPKLSVVIPVYNEKATIEEILRRVLETEMRMEIVIVDDCSTDGTRQYLEAMMQAQRKARHGRRLMMGAIRWMCGICGFSSSRKTRAKAQLCGGVLRRRRATSCWCKMRIWSMTRKIIRHC